MNTLWNFLKAWFATGRQMWAILIATASLVVTSSLLSARFLAEIIYSFCQLLNSLFDSRMTKPDFTDGRPWAASGIEWLNYIFPVQELFAFLLQWILISCICSAIKFANFVVKKISDVAPTGG